MYLDVKGAVDRMVNGYLTGWAYHPTGNKHVKLVVSVDGRDVLKTVADIFRPDLKNKGIGDGHHGFIVRITGEVFSENSETTIQVRTESEGQELKGSPFKANATHVSGQLGTIMDGNVHGWVAPQLPVPHPITVELLIDGLVRGQATPTLLRDDLKHFNLADRPTGLQFELPADIRDGKEHIIELREASQRQPLHGSPRTYRATQEEVSLAQRQAATAQANANAPLPSQPDPGQKFNQLLQAADKQTEDGRYDEAITLLDQAQSIEPSSQEAFIRKAKVLEDCADRSRLIAHFATAETRFPKRLDWRVRYIALRRQSGAETWALDAFEALVKEFPDTLPPKLQAGHTARSLGLYKLALEWFQRAYKVSNDGNAAIQCAMEHINLGQPDQAQEWLDKVPPDSNAADSLSWLQILLTMQTDRAAAAQQYLQLLGTVDNPTRLTQLLRQGRQHGFYREVETAYQAPLLANSVAACWELHALRVRNLLDLGKRRAARSLLSTIPEHTLSAIQLIEAAELWHSACCPARAQSLLQAGVRQILTMPAPSSNELETALRVCHQSGEPQLRDEIFDKTYDPDGRCPVPRVMTHAQRLWQEGRGAEARSFLDAECTRNPDMPLDRWQARFAHQHHHYQDAISTLKSQITVPVVALEDAKLWVRCLIDAEELDQAEEQLDRLGTRYADSDTAPLRAEILRKNLRLEDAIDNLRTAQKQYPADQQNAQSLAASLLDFGELSEAESLIEQNLTTRPVSIEWGSLKLRWATAGFKEWSPWLEAHNTLQTRMNYNHRLRLLMTYTHMLMFMRDHDKAERLLRRISNKVMDLPLPKHVITGYALQSANLWACLGQPETSASLLTRIEKSGIPGGHKDFFYRVSAFNESFGNRSAEQFIALRNRISNRRQHVSLASPALYANASDNIQAPPLRVAVLIHLFYQDIWPELYQYLRSLKGTNFRLFVSIPGKGIEQKRLEQLRDLDPEVQIYTTENRGFDVGAHWQTLEHINLAEFDLALLLQTKKSSHVKIGSIWRDNLIKALLGTPKRWRENLHAFYHTPEIGLVGSILHHHSVEGWDYKEMRQVLEALGMPTRFDELKPYCEYVGGTMFLIRTNLLQEIHTKTRKQLTFERYEDLTLAKRIDKTLAHAMERTFAMYVKWRGYQIMWRD